MRQLAMAFLAGFLFAVGLGLSDMTRPARIVGFLDVAGDWDPTLLFVILGAVGTYAVIARFVLRRPAPVLAPRFTLPAGRAIDGQLIAGSVLFGVGWGLGGYCPGPGFTALVSAQAGTLAVVLPMLAGIALYEALPGLRGRLGAPRPRPRSGEAPDTAVGLVDG